MKIQIILPYEVKYILGALHENGYESYVVGGCVRDSFLGRIPGDFDITTSALPDEVTGIFGEKYTIPTGIKYGTVTVLVNGQGFEVTTYRVDLEYKDGRRPEGVRFSSSINEELGRRDFTINAMAYNEDYGIIDLFSGLEDLQKKIIRCVGDPGTRFKEDGLRMMRAVRFAAQLGFEIEKDTLDSISKNSSLLKRVSSERIMVELNKTLLSDNPSKLRLFFSTGLMEYMMPEVVQAFKTSDGNSLEETIKVIENIEPVLHLRMAVFLSCLAVSQGDDSKGRGREDIKTLRTILRRLKYDNLTRAKIISKFENSNVVVDVDKRSIRRLLCYMGEENLRDILKIKKAYVMASGFCEDKYSKLEAAQKNLDEIIDNNECFSIKGLSIDGHDLIKLGIEGKEIGTVLKRLLGLVVEDPSINTKDKLIDLIKTYSNIREYRPL